MAEGADASSAGHGLHDVLVLLVLLVLLVFEVIWTADTGLKMKAMGKVLGLDSGMQVKRYRSMV
ncbi:MAG: hypothetical protein B7Z37_23120 [Verrucomicrobia bacterium 12-59-8]|nr:MAG: hypothetical protein B7Z37_23120 [Verrucomicrobia bacterium 12-59-8]